MTKSGQHETRGSARTGQDGTGQGETKLGRMGFEGIRSNRAGLDVSGSARTGQDGARLGRIRPTRVRLNQAVWDPGASDQLDRIGPKGVSPNWAGWNPRGSDHTRQDGVRLGRIGPKVVTLNQAG